MSGPLSQACQRLEYLAEAQRTGFQHPWEARAFAIVVKLAEAGYFTWAEWVVCLSERIRDADSAGADGKRPASYSEQWITAAEDLLVRKGMTSVEQLRARRLAAWPLVNDHQPRQNAG